eukprot:9409916-Pyramimonas_sp.AAC.1
MEVDGCTSPPAWFSNVSNTMSFETFATVARSQAGPFPAATGDWTSSPWYGPVHRGMDQKPLPSPVPRSPGRGGARQGRCLAVAVLSLCRRRRVVRRRRGSEGREFVLYHPFESAHVAATDSP